MAKKVEPVVPEKERAYLKQSDVPGATLDEALRIPTAIYEHFAGQPTAPLMVARALNVDPGGSQLKVLSGAAIAFGLIEGGAQAASISITPLAERILRPTEDGMDLDAKREAMLRPRIFQEFLTKYNGKSLPREDLGLNVLETMGVPRDKTRDVFTRLIESAEGVDLITQIKDKKYVSLNGTNRYQAPNHPADDEPTAVDDYANGEPRAEFSAVHTTPRALLQDDDRRRRVFITHGKNKSFVEPLKKLLEFGELKPVVSVEKQSVSKPVPEKVMDEMRACGAAIIHVDAESRMTDAEGNEHAVLNPNVLIEIGAAMAFYGRRFILLVRDGVKLPSNLQGLYEVRYSDDALGRSSPKLDDSLPCASMACS
jgi:hypothetical protein